MSWVKELFQYLSDIFKWWITVLPWQQGIRVRFGKHETLLTKGMYWKFPIIDSVFVLGTRLKYDQIPIMTITTLDKFVITVNGAIAYQIIDINKLYHTIDNPSATLSGIAMSSISEYITKHNLNECTPDLLEKAVDFKGDNYGIDASIKITGFAVVKTFRLIQDHAWMPTSKEYEI